MSWLKKISQLDPSRRLSGPLVDNIISTVSTMFGRGAPIERNDWGFNGTDYLNQKLRAISSYPHGASVLVSDLVYAIQILWKYNNTQLGGQIRELRQELESQIAGPVVPGNVDPNITAPNNPDQSNIPTTNIVKVLGYGSSFDRDKVKIYIPGADDRISDRAINKMIRENAPSLGYTESLQSGGPNYPDVYDFPMRELRRKDKSSFDTWLIHKNFIPAFYQFLQQLNNAEQEKFNRAQKRNKPYELFVWDLSELESFIGGSNPVATQLLGVRIKPTPGGNGLDYLLSFDFSDKEFIQKFKSFVSETLGWYRPRWLGNAEKEWQLQGIKAENFGQLADLFADNGFDASPLRLVAEELSKRQPVSNVAPDKQLIPLMVQNISQQGNFHMNLSVPRLRPEDNHKYYQSIKLSFPRWNIDRFLNTRNFVYSVKGDYATYVDFAKILKAQGFDVSQLRQVFSELLQSKVISKQRLNGELDGYPDVEKFREASKSILRPGNKLYPAQHEGVEFLYSRNAAFLGDETGAGKTLQSVIAADLRMRQDSSRCLIVTLSSTLKQWEKEIVKFTGDNSISNNPNDKARWTLISYPMLSAPKNGPFLLESIKAQNYGVAIFDEVHNTKNESARTKRIHDLGQNIPFKWGLSATVSANYPIDVWRQLRTIGHRLGNLSESAFRTGVLDQVYQKGRFGGEWLNKGETETERERNGLRAAAFMNEWLTKYAGIYIRRSKRDINPNVSNHTIVESPISLSSKEISTFNKAVEKRMGQYSDPSLAISEMIAERAEIASAKVPYTLELVDNVLTQNKKVLVFTCFRPTAAELEAGVVKSLGKFGGNVVSILGGDKDREAKLNSFKTDPNTKVMILSILAGGTGIDLPNIVDDVIINDFSWTPKDAEQSEGRAYRVTSESDVNTRYVIAENTVDEAFYNVVQLKRKLASEVDKATTIDAKVNIQQAINAIDRQFAQKAKELAGDPAKLNALVEQLKNQAESLTVPQQHKASSWLRRTLFNVV